MLGIWSAGLVLTPVPTFEKKKEKKGSANAARS